MKKLSEIVPLWTALEIIGASDPAITALCEDSREVVPGALFFARTGASHDGKTYINDAICAGAAAIASNHYIDSLSPEISQLIYPDMSALMGEMADAFYDYPSKELLCIGITGTSGKTSTSYWVRYLLEKLGVPCGLLGTVEQVTGTSRMPAHLTTPSAITCHRLLAEMVKNHLRAAVMEVSSHSLDQKRVAGIHFEAAIFTNLTPEHLDYHTSMEAYGEAKLKLFLEEKLSCLNIEDPFSTTIALHAPGEIVTFGKGGDVEGQILAEDRGLHVEVQAWGQKGVTIIPGYAPFQLSNFLGALSCLLPLGYQLEEILQHAPHFPGVPGRMEQIENERGIDLIIDYAHKPDALKQVLQALRPRTVGRLLVLFGCGGERDQHKRPLMGQIAEQYADHVWITSDNPRSEDPLAIMEAIAAGCKEKKATLMANRMQAIYAALEEARAGDCLLIAGRGHESHQIIGKERIPFNDAAVVRKALGGVLVQ